MKTSLLKNLSEFYSLLENILRNFISKIISANNQTFHELKKSPLKISTVTFLIILGIVEFIRKNHLHNLGVPFFVLDGEPIITHYSYGKVLVSFFGISVFGWIGFTIFFLGLSIKNLISRILLWGVSFVFLLMISLLIFGVLEHSVPNGKLIYLSKDYEVYRLEEGVQVKIGSKIFNCHRTDVFTDICTEVQ